MTCKEPPPDCQSLSMIYLRHGDIECPACLVCADPRHHEPWPEEVRRAGELRRKRVGRISHHMIYFRLYTFTMALLPLTLVLVILSLLFVKFIVVVFHFVVNVSFNGGGLRPAASDEGQQMLNQSAHN